MSPDKVEGGSMDSDLCKSPLDVSSYLTSFCISATVFYEPSADEFLEDNFSVPGETPPDDEGDGSDIPVRILSDFAIFEEDTKEIVPFGQLLVLDYSDTRYSAVGLVSAWADPDDDDEDSSISESAADEATYRLRCPHILEISIHNLIDKSKRLDG